MYHLMALCLLQKLFTGNEWRANGRGLFQQTMSAVVRSTEENHNKYSVMTTATLIEIRLLILRLFNDVVSTPKFLQYRM